MAQAHPIGRRRFLKTATALVAGVLPFSAWSRWQEVSGPLPVFSLPTLGGGEVSLQSLRGRVVLVNFWATWCPPCVEEFPELVHLQQTYRAQGLTIAAINLGESPSRIRKFLGDYSIPESEVVIGLDNASIMSKKWGVRAVPTTFLINRQGRPVKSWAGAISIDDQSFMKEIKTLLGEPNRPSPPKS